MAEFERVPLRPRPKRNWLPSAVIGVTVFIGLAIVKPWDFGRPQTGAGGGTPPPTFFVRPTERTGARPYDPILFGFREPDPAWELWPAGYVVEFGMSGPVRVHGQDAASPAPGESRAPGDSPAPPAASSRPPGPSRSRLPTAPVATPAVDDGVVDLGTAAHLVALGINTPAAFHVETATLSMLIDDAIRPIAIVRLPTFWESEHFIVIAPEDPVAAGQAAAWEPGLYRLVLTPTFGEVRSIDLRVRAGLADR
jgi:hypothetical protein